MLPEEPNHVFQMVAGCEILNRQHGHSKEAVHDENLCKDGQNGTARVSCGIFHQACHVRDRLDTGKAQDKARENSPVMKEPSLWLVNARRRKGRRGRCDNYNEECQNGDRRYH